MNWLVAGNPCHQLACRAAAGGCCCKQLQERRRHWYSELASNHVLAQLYSIYHHHQCCCSRCCCCYGYAIMHIKRYQHACYSCIRASRILKMKSCKIRHNSLRVNPLLWLNQIPNRAAACFTRLANLALLLVIG